MSTFNNIYSIYQSYFAINSICLLKAGQLVQLKVAILSAIGTILLELDLLSKILLLNLFPFKAPFWVHKKETSLVNSLISSFSPESLGIDVGRRDCLWLRVCLHIFIRRQIWVGPGPISKVSYCTKKDYNWENNSKVKPPQWLLLGGRLLNLASLHVAKILGRT